MIKARNETVDMMLEEHGVCLNFTPIGGYTLIYQTDSGEIWCGDCATEEPDEVKTVATYDEGERIECDGCGEMICPSYEIDDEDEF